jgi:hypothetical protein
VYNINIFSGYRFNLLLENISEIKGGRVSMTGLSMRIGGGEALEKAADYETTYIAYFQHNSLH